MILTEAEAKEKRCTFNLARGLLMSAAEQKCIASGCMAWRWIASDKSKAFNVATGYCGAAGKP